MSSFLNGPRRSLRRPATTRLLALLAAAAAGFAMLAAGGGAETRDPNLPVSTTRPLITGVRVGQTLTASTGAWSSKTPLQYFVQWVRSDGQGHWIPIPGAKSLTYTVGPEDIGYQLFVQVKAVNATGPTWVNTYTTSFATGPTQAKGTIKLPTGSLSVPADALELPDRLLIKGISYTPSRISSREFVIARFTVTDTAGHPVSGAQVSVLGVPFGALQTVSRQATGLDGVATFRLVATKTADRVPGKALALLVRASKPGESVLAGVSAARLVKLPLATGS